MPVYEFTCTTCGRQFEKAMPLNADHSGVRCPAGHSQVQRRFSAPVVVFKGSGFYSTDHRSASGSKSDSA